VTPQNNFKEIFARLFGQVLDTHVVDDQQIGFEVFRQNPILSGEGLIRHQLPYQIEDRTIQNCTRQSIHSIVISSPAASCEGVKNSSTI
jgi:hypothetical protein